MPRRRPSDHLLLQRRPGQLDRLAAHGLFRPEACRNSRRPASAGRSLQTGRQSPTACSTPATWSSSTCREPALAACTGKDTEKAFWGVDEDAQCLCPLYRAVHQQVQPLEFAEVSLWRELRNHALGCAGRTCSKTRRHRPERRDSAFADLQFHIGHRRGAHAIPGIDLPFETGAADLRGDRVVPPQAAASSPRSSSRS